MLVKGEILILKDNVEGRKEWTGTSRGGWRFEQASIPMQKTPEVKTHKSRHQDAHSNIKSKVRVENIKYG